MRSDREPPENENERNEEPAPEEAGSSRAVRRQEDFMEQRTKIIHPRGEEPAATPTPPAPDEPHITDGEAEGPMEPGFRRRMIDEYRRRQIEGEGAAPAPAIDETPEAPVPPPATNWIPIGPSVVRRGQASNRPAVSGRVTGLAVTPGETVVYAASANGGVWRSDDRGQSWRSLMEAFDLNPTHHAADSLACGAIAIDQGNPDRIFVGTGEPFGALDSYFGVGPISSDNGGLDWETEPSAPGSPTLEGRGFFQLAMDPNDPQRLVAATVVGLYRREPDGAGGFQWARKRDSEHTSVVAASDGGTAFFAASRNGGVFRSANGDAWTALTAGFPTANVGRIGLAVRPESADAVYALIERPDTHHVLGVWRWEASDNRWFPVNNIPGDLFGPSPANPGQGWYDLSIAVDPNDDGFIYLGGGTRPVPGIPGAEQYSAAIYRCEISQMGSGATRTYQATATSIGETVHADVHALVFTPGSPDRLWVACDGGVFVTDDARGAAAFQARNVGLSTLSMEHIGMHPTEDAVMFCGVQDNGTVRYTGDEAWLHSRAGDGGFAVVNWNNPYQALSTYIRGWIYRTTDGGSDYTSWAWAGLPAAQVNQALFYGPLAGTPPGSADPAHANIVAMGGVRPWTSTDFGASWSSVPANSGADALPNPILSLVFASPTRFYAGTMGGEVYRFDDDGVTWQRTRIDAAPLLVAPISDIAVDPADPATDSIYVTLGGGAGDYRRAWHFDGASWEARSGPAAGSADSLLDVQHNAIGVDPDNTSHLYAGADIGVWRSTDAGATWSAYSEGLPDAAVLDLKLHPGRRLLWAATHGRSVYERAIDAANAPGVDLYIRRTQLDRGRRPVEDGLADPTRPGQTVHHRSGPGIKVDAPSAAGDYQTPDAAIDFFEFVDLLEDRGDQVATIDPASGTLINRVYVQVHNRGVQPAPGVAVTLLLAELNSASPDLGAPDLPAGYDADIRAGNPIVSTTWRTVGTRTLEGVRVGLPQVAAFDLPSSLLPAPAALSGHDRHCLVAIIHSPQDQFNASERNIDTLTQGERKAAVKQIRVVSHAGAPPAPAVEWPEVREGEESTRVRALQLLLREHRLSLAVDGDFGPRTEEAVRRFQASRGLPETGTVNGETWERLILVRRRGDKGYAVRALQVLLAAAGNRLAVDGDFGPITESAVERVRAGMGGPASGVADASVWNWLARS